jgi:hypothetical protein
MAAGDLDAARALHAAAGALLAVGAPAPAGRVVDLAEVRRARETPGKGE